MNEQEALAAAKLAADRADFGSAIAILRPFAEGGHREAQFELGRLVLTECEALSGREGFALLYSAALQGHPAAQLEVATYPSFPSEPFESPLDLATRWQFLLAAAGAGVVEAQYHAAASLATGEFADGSIQADLVAAVAWYRRASEAGHSSAQFNLACMLLNGEGCEVDRDAAITWLTSAAGAGDLQAREYLAELTDGVGE